MTLQSKLNPLLTPFLTGVSASAPRGGELDRARGSPLAVIVQTLAVYGLLPVDLRRPRKEGSVRCAANWTCRELQGTTRAMQPRTGKVLDASNLINLVAARIAHLRCENALEFKNC